MKKKHLLGFLSLGIVACLSGGIAFLISHADTPSDLFQETYQFNQTIAIPDYSFDGIKADKTVQTPEGGAYRVDALKLDSYGWYTVSYMAMIDGKLKTHEEKFFVNAPTYYVDGEGASYAYEETDYSEGNKDLVVTLTENSTFYYEKIVNLSENTSADDVLSFYVVPGSVGTADVGYLFVKFTDIYDPNINFTVRFSSYSYGGDDGSYATATFADQGFVGTERWNGKIYTDSYGMYNITNFTGVVRQSTNNRMYDRLFKIRYDAATKELYSPNYIFKNGTDIYNSLFSDLDNSSFYDRAFSGFTTGEVRISVYAESFKTSSAKIAFVDINGDDCSSDILAENTAPVLTVEEAAITPPVAAVGKAYTVFEATAYDKGDGDIPVNINVYYSYGSTLQEKVTIKNGEFTPTKEGLYTIVYSAKDKLGEEIKQTIQVRAENSLSNIELEFSQSTLEGLAGNAISLPSYTINGGEAYGKEFVEIKVLDPNGEECTVNDGKFVPMTDGEYTITVLATMRNGISAEKSCIVNVQENLEPVFLDEVELPDYYLHGAGYVVPELKAYDLSNGAIEIPVKTFYKNSDGAEIEATNRMIYPLGVYGDENSKVEIVYRATAANGETNEKVYSVKVINPTNDEGYDYAKLFVAKNAVVAPTESGVSISTNLDGEVSYIKEINQNMLYWGIKVNPEKIDFKQIDFCLTDSVDNTQTIKVSVLKNKNKPAEIVMILNDGLKQYKLGGSIGGVESLDEAAVISLSYNPQMKKISDLLNPAITIKKTLNDKPFEGFTSGAVKLTMKLVGVTGNAEIFWESIGNQYFFGEIGADYVSPTGVFTKDCGGTYKLHDKFIVPAVKTYDFIAPNVSAMVSVQTPSGEYATTIDGVIMNNVVATKDYYIEGAEFGEYIVNYVLTDSNDNSNYSLSFMAIIVDAVAPEIILSGNVPTEAQVGKTVVLPKATISENEGEYKFVVMVVANNGRRVAIENYKFIPQVGGEYTVHYMAVDTAGNMTLKTFIVSVKA